MEQTDLKEQFAKDVLPVEAGRHAPRHRSTAAAPRSAPS